MKRKLTLALAYLMLNGFAFGQCPAGSTEYILSTGTDPTVASSWTDDNGDPLPSFATNNVCYQLTSSFVIIFELGVSAVLTQDWTITGTGSGLVLPYSGASIDNANFSMTWPADFEVYGVSGTDVTYSKNTTNSTSDLQFEDFVFFEGDILLTGDGTNKHSVNGNDSLFPNATLTVNLAGASGDDDVTFNGDVSFGNVVMGGTSRVKLADGATFSISETYNNTNTSEEAFTCNSSNSATVAFSGVEITGANGSLLGMGNCLYSFSGNNTFAGNGVWQFGSSDHVAFDTSGLTQMLEDFSEGGIFFTEDFSFENDEEVYFDLVTNGNSDIVLHGKTGSDITFTTGSIDSLVVEGEFRINNDFTELFQVNDSIQVINGGDFVVEDGAEVEVPDFGIYVDGASNLVQLGTGEFNQLGTDDPANIDISNDNPWYSWGHYTYWSTPIQNQRLSWAFYSSYYYTDRGEGLADWVYFGSGTMDPGRGYALNQSSGNVSLQGLPNNGTINNGTPVAGPTQGGRTESWTLVGNPYPSGIHAYTFLTNFSNSGTVEGAVYIWDQEKSGSVWDQYESEDYTVINGTGVSWVGNQYNDTIDASNYWIAPFQGFFVEGQETFGTNVEFTNAMRDPDLATGMEHSFKAGSTSKKLWLYSKQENSASSFLVGFLRNATKGWDRMYDASGNGGKHKLRSVVGGREAAIEGQSEFSADKKVDLKVSLHSESTVEIGVQHTVGFEAEQGMWLIDSVANTHWDLSSGSYSYAPQPGETERNLLLVFQDPEEVVGLAEKHVEMEAFAIERNGEISIKSNGVKLTEFNHIGQLISERNVQKGDQIFIEKNGLNIYRLVDSSGRVLVFR